MHAPRKMQWHYFKNAGCPHRGVMKKLNPLSAAALMYSGFKNQLSLETINRLVVQTKI